jgi:hypothetical protein
LQYGNIDAQSFAAANNPTAVLRSRERWMLLYLTTPDSHPYAILAYAVLLAAARLLLSRNVAQRETSIARSERNQASPLRVPPTRGNLLPNPIQPRIRSN